MATPGTNLFPIGPINGGQTLRLALGAPAMGLISKAMVVQLNQDGTAAAGASLEGFNYTFYNSAVACPPSPNGQPTPTANEPAVKAAAEAQGQTSITYAVPSGKDRYLLADGVTPAIGLNVPYINSDGGLSNASTKLYMKLTVLGSATNKYFGIFMGIAHYRG
jgi:hypothetical protein